MNIRIQGGGSGTHANRGSSVSIVSYLEHENKEKIKEGNFEELKPFFSQHQDQVPGQSVIYNLDNNKRKLTNKDSKFFVVTISPSKAEVASMGQDKEKAMQDYTRIVMQGYAENFNKGLGAKDLMYYAKVHEERKRDSEIGLHAHVIVSRKDLLNKIKLSPKTNHRGTKSGAVRGGFDRVDFFRKCEASFDKKFSHKREFEQSFDYLNTMKNGTPKDIPELQIKRREFKSLEKNKPVEKVKTQAAKKTKNRDVGFTM